MAALIEWGTVGAIFGESLGAGIIVVGAFAIGARVLATTTGDVPVHERRGASFALAILCFLIAAAAVGYGVYFTIDK